MPAIERTMLETEQNVWRDAPQGIYHILACELNKFRFSAPGYTSYSYSLFYINTWVWGSPYSSNMLILV